MKGKHSLIKAWLMFIILCTALLTAAAIALADEIKIGVIGPMKFINGEHTALGAQMAADEINAAGGIQVKGKKYQVAILKTDDNSFRSMPDAVSAMERIVTLDKVKFVIGGCRTEAVLAQQEIMADNKIIFLGTGSAEGGLSIAKNFNRYKYFFRVAPSQGSLGDNYGGIQYVGALEPVIKALKTELGIQKPKVALMVEKGKWADFMLDYAKVVFPKMGCELVGEWRPGFTATSVTAELSAIKSAGAHIIFQISAGPSGNILSKQWGELKIPAALVGLGVEAQKEGHWKATEGLCNYSATSDAISSVIKTKKTKAFVTSFQKKYNAAPMYNAPAAYDAVYILKEAIEKAGTLDADALVPVIEKTDFVGPDARVRFTPPSHHMPHGCIIGPENTWVSFQWRDGKQVVYWPDGHEIHPALIEAGAPKGWDKARFEGSGKYVLPPWVVEYWKGKK
jgi:branched-chain amino acid transport system substrate-binding protein